MDFRDNQFERGDHLMDEHDAGNDYLMDEHDAGDDGDVNVVDSYGDASSFVSPRSRSQDTESCHSVASFTSSNATATSTRFSSDVYMHVEAEEVFQTPRKQTKSIVWTCKRCAACDKVQQWQARSTSNFRYHLEKHHSDEYVSSTKTHSTAPRVSSSEWTSKDQEEATRALVEWVVTHAQPLRVVEEDTFKAFCARLRPEYNIPSRPTLRSRLLSAWREAKAQVRATVRRELNGRRFGTTTDMWTSVAKRGYMVVTMHYITDDWQVRAVMVGFVRVLSPHTGIRLATHFITSFQEMDAGLLQSLWCVTCDNASNNDVMATELSFQMARVLHSPQNEELVDVIPRQPQEIVRVRCMAHVLQLAIKEGLNQSPIIRSTIAIVRQTMKKIDDSPKLIEKLKECCVRANISDLEPVLDVDTRWNSTWYMIDRALKLRVAIDDLLRRIRQRHDGYSDLSISPNDRLARGIGYRAWAVAKQYRHFLLPFKDATTLLSSASYPTLGMIAPIYWVTKRHAGHIESDDDATETPHNQVVADATADATVGEETDEVEVVDPYTNDDDAERDAARDPSFVAFDRAVMRKMKVYEHCISTKEAQIAAAVDPRIKSLVTTFGMDQSKLRGLLIAEYNANYRVLYEARQNEPSVGSDCARGRRTSGHDDDLSTLRSLLNTESSHSNNTSDFNNAFTTEVDNWFCTRDGLECGDKSTAVCEWFRAHGAKYPRVQMIARDFLGLPATSVASEFAFSKAGCTIRDRRARLGDDSIRAILELQSFNSFLGKSQ